MTIDYERMQRNSRRQKSALTRAINSGEPEKVVKACREAMADWDACGAWPDDWHRWNVACRDATGLELDDLAAYNAPDEP